MYRYNPDQAPNPLEWLALDELLRISAVENYHRRAGIRLPKAKIHAVFHVIIENQLAEGIEPIVRAMARLAAEGLSRHEALHAIGSVLAEHINDLFHGKADEANAQAVYEAAVDRLTAKAWRGD